MERDRTQEMRREAKGLMNAVCIVWYYVYVCVSMHETESVPSKCIANNSPTPRSKENELPWVGLNPGHSAI